MKMDEFEISVKKTLLRFYKKALLLKNKNELQSEAQKMYDSLLPASAILSEKTYSCVGLLFSIAYPEVDARNDSHLFDDEIKSIISKLEK